MNQCPRCFRPQRCTSGDCDICECGYMFPTLQEEQEDNKTVNDIDQKEIDYNKPLYRKVKDEDIDKGWVGPWTNKK